MVDGLAIKGKSLANVGVRCRGDGVDSCVQVGVKTLGGFFFFVSGGRRHALGGAGEAGRSPPWP